jgi:hypothetical protein
MCFRPTQGAQGFNCGWQRKLFADKAIDESAAANFPARFKAPIDGEQTAPGRHVRFARQELAEDDAVAIEQLTPTSFDDRLRANLLGNFLLAP